MNFRKFFESKQGFMAPETATKIKRAITNIGGNVWVVGGAVRDFINPDSPASKDIDLLVTDLPIQSPEKALQRIIAALKPIAGGKVDVVGESFGVIKAMVDGEDLDIAIPRASETKTGTGHVDFSVQLDPTASVESDLARRDFTINAIASSLDGKTIVDPFKGREDIQNKKIRAVGNARDRFSEDPLRILRSIQFATRFGYTISEDTLKAMKELSSEISTVAGERILEELKKAITKGKGDMKVLVSILNETGIGKEVFGKDFDPIAIGSENPTSKFIGLFFNGGDMQKIKTTNDLRDSVLLAREFAGLKLPYEFIGKHSDKLEAVRSFFYNAGMDKENRKVEKAMHTAITPKELAIKGQEFLDMGVKGKDIGRLQRVMLQKIWLGSINNTIDDLVGVIKEELNEDFDY